jgi:hypothetical protein
LENHHTPACFRETPKIRLQTRSFPQAFPPASLITLYEIMPSQLDLDFTGLLQGRDNAGSPPF